MPTLRPYWGGWAPEESIWPMPAIRTPLVALMADTQRRLSPLTNPSALDVESPCTRFASICARHPPDSDDASHACVVVNVSVHASWAIGGQRKSRPLSTVDDLPMVLSMNNCPARPAMSWMTAVGSAVVRSDSSVGVTHARCNRAVRGSSPRASAPRVLGSRSTVHDRLGGRCHEGAVTGRAVSHARHTATCTLVRSRLTSTHWRR